MIRILIRLALMTVAVQVALSGQTPSEYLPQPDHWVPFSANVEIVGTGRDGSTQVVRGRFWRGADGSTRLETGPSEDDVRVTSINNLTKEVTYVGPTKSGTWLEQPMPPPGPFGRKPIQYTTRMVGLTLNFGEVEGFKVHRYINPNGDEWLWAPDLNFFPLVRRMAGGRRLEQYSNVQVGDQASSLFEPPAGVTIEKRPVSVRPRASAPGNPRLISSATRRACSGPPTARLA